jgi:predicted short-subunit dehydrogenase-like oxidoreductase (DUF2520 family)
MLKTGKKSKKTGKKKRRPNAARPFRGKETVSVVGAGRLGTALGRALLAAGYWIEAVVTRHGDSAKSAARLIGSRPCPLTVAELGKLSNSDLVFVATPDDAIAETARQLANAVRSVPGSTLAGSLPSRKRTALHTSGAVTSEVLSPLKELGFAIGSMHPLVAVSDPVSGAELFRGAFFFVEGDRRAARLARRIVRELGGRSFSITAGDKALYHAAAVMASGHVVALFDIAVEMLRRAGLSSKRAREALLPLVESTMANLSAREPARALTGTFARGDVTTMRRHLAAMQSAGLDDAEAAYILLGKRSLKLKDRATKKHKKHKTD